MSSSIDGINAALAATTAWLALGMLGLLRPHSVRWVGRVLFPISAALSLVLAGIGLASVLKAPQAAVLPLGLPDLLFHVRLDPLSGFFLFLLGVTATGISIFSAGYFRTGEGTPPGLMCFQYHLFLASMGAVLLADDAYLFMVAWETMALASYFLVTTHHRLPEIRQAGFLYLLIAHVGALGILLCFGVMHGTGWQFTFDAMRTAHLAPGWSSVAFGLALFGFGAKAGMVPLHVWLPEAHPAAPSPVSALMSGVMLKTAIYGLIRVTYDLLGTIRWEWGLTVLIAGSVTTLFGVLFALMQHHLKRLLAYHSIENIGIILIGLGLSLTYIGTGHPALGALGLAAALYHTLNHAVFKSLLFLGAGSIQHVTGERELGRMGGLARWLPRTAFLFLVGSLAISALPPLNGFVSEWLTFQAALLSPALESGVLRSVIPLAAAGLALAGALTAMCFVKVYGVVFLGAPRAPKETELHDVGRWEQTGMAWLAAGCVILGLAPVPMLRLLDHVARLLIGQSLGSQALRSGWLWLTPVAAERASYNPIVFLVLIVGVTLLTFVLVRRFYHGRLRRAPAWDCGFGGLDARMQDTAEGFSQPIRHMFGPVYEMERHLPSASDAKPRFHLEIRDRFWSVLYLPLAGLVEAVSRQVGRLQAGRISIYLLYSFLTTIFLLLFV
ncbi:MAG: hydrogenase 4 subunit B [Gammaproteobacteria bacterium]|nr:hydrogenase 4 subunit B [Gammaproteobacteria bacterium]